MDTWLKLPESLSYKESGACVNSMMSKTQNRSVCRKNQLIYRFSVNVKWYRWSKKCYCATQHGVVTSLAGKWSRVDE